MAASKKEVKKVDIKLAALSPYIVDNVEQAVEKTINGKDFVGWGENNRYFEYLYDLYATNHLFLFLFYFHLIYKCKNLLIE